MVIPMVKDVLIVAVNVMLKFWGYRLIPVTQFNEELTLMGHNNNLHL